MSKIALIGGSELFRRFLSLTGADIESTSVETAIRSYGFDGMILVPGYDEGEDKVPELSMELLDLLAAKKRAGFRVYVENYDATSCVEDSIFGYSVLGGVCHTTNEALLAQNGLQFALGGDRLLQAANVCYLPVCAWLRDVYTSKNQVLLSLGRYPGTSQVTTLNIPHSYPVLMRTGSVISAVFSLTNFDTVNMRPNYRFKKLFGYIFSHILNVDTETVEQAFSACYPPLGTRLPCDSIIESESRAALYEQAVKSAVRWHFDSGIIQGENGEGGSLEMIMSNNNQRIYRNHRTDAGFYTAWLLMAAGKHFGNEHWHRSGKNIFDFFRKRARLTEGVVNGMYNWYVNENASPQDVYSIDLGRDGIALCNIYQLTKDESLLADIRALADAVDGWISGDQLTSQSIPHTKINPARHIVTGGTRTPAIYGELSSFMSMASVLLDEPQYVEKMKKVCDMLLRAYPDFDYYGHTTSSRSARFLMTLLTVHLSGAGDYTDMINEQIDYLDSLRTPCGGIYSEDNITFEKNIHTGNGESGITAPWENDRISDQLYCVNNALAALSLLLYAPRDGKLHTDKGLRLFEALLDYVTKIQIVSPDGRFNGGWMRAFSMTHGEYYGMDADILWSSYCIMAGWTMGMIPLALLSHLKDECPYLIKKESEQYGE